jgi:hypothetical protein
VGYPQRYPHSALASGLAVVLSVARVLRELACGGLSGGVTHGKLACLSDAGPSVAGVCDQKRRLAEFYRIIGTEKAASLTCAAAKLPKEARL